MLSAIKFEFKILKKRNVIEKIVLLVLVFTLLYQIAYFYNNHNLSQLGRIENNYFFSDISKAPFFYAFIFCLPIVIPLLNGNFYFKDYKVAPFIYTRLDKLNYLIVKCVFSFLIGFIIAFLFMFLTLVISWIILLPNDSFFYALTPKHSDLEIIQYGANFMYSTAFNNLYFNHPIFYYCIYICAISAMAGISSVFSFLITMFTKKRIISNILPFVIFYGITCFPTYFLPMPYKQYTLVSLLTPLTDIQNASIVPVCWLIIIILSVLVTVIITWFFSKGDLDNG